MPGRSRLLTNSSFLAPGPSRSTLMVFQRLSEKTPLSSLQRNDVKCRTINLSNVVRYRRRTSPAPPRKTGDRFVLWPTRRGGVRRNILDRPRRSRTHLLLETSSSDYCLHCGGRERTALFCDSASGRLPIGRRRRRQ